ncbi:MAG: hypothetical protein LBF50_02045 [Azoarcus sp.]|jgi:uncharacterized coiled-coil protein SlyX|nr:hypothetical protein [Azoarcus sp.]
MSGPTTVSMLFHNMIVEAIADHEASLAVLEARCEAREARRLARLAENRERMTRLRTQIDQLEQKLARIAALAEEDLPDFTARRATLQGAGLEDWGAYIQELEARITALEGRLAASAAQTSVQAALAEIGETPEIADLLRLYLAQRQAMRQEADQTAWKTTVARILARLDLPAGEALPPRLEALARAVILAETPEKADLWGNELRFAVQQYRAEKKLRQKDARDAEAWLNLFPEDFLPAPLHALLSEAAAGLSRLDAESREALEDLAARFGAESEAKKNQAAALVLERSLLDLGYQVENIGETLFSEGGVVHFQKAGWDEYHVRLRANAEEKTINFNVVRPNDVEEHALRRQRDFMAEERWCAEFPKLMETLAARGLGLEVERHLAAGELPVQAVPPERLPVFAKETNTRRRAAPRPRSLEAPESKRG